MPADLRSKFSNLPESEAVLRPRDVACNEPRVKVKASSDKAAAVGPRVRLQTNQTCPSASEGRRHHYKVPDDSSLPENLPATDNIMCLYSESTDVRLPKLKIA
eukprot:3665047-Amphidinium_carterae.1